TLSSRFAPLLHRFNSAANPRNLLIATLSLATAGSCWLALAGKSAALTTDTPDLPNKVHSSRATDMFYFMTSYLQLGQFVNIFRISENRKKYMSLWDSFFLG